MPTTRSRQNNLIPLALVLSISSIFAALMSPPITPYAPAGEQGTDSSKLRQVERMFDNISPYYDLLNRVLSLGIDRQWRKQAVELLPMIPRMQILDMATGTGGVALEIVRQRPNAHVTGIDLSQDMLARAGAKVAEQGLESQVSLIKGASEAIAFPDDYFDAATVAFGVRNFEDTLRGLREMQRVLRPGGKIIVLEFSRIRTFPVKQAFNLYFGRVLPWIGRVWSSDPRAYRYLYESVQAFPDGKDFGQLLETAGFVQPSWQTLTFGICTVYTASVPTA